MNNEVKIPEHRLFKWIGGKNWLKKKLYEQSKNHIKNSTIYIEPFAGGLGSFMAIYPNLKNIEKIILNDINTILIETYKTVKNNPKELILEINKINDEFYKLIPDTVYSYNKTKDKYKVKKELEKANEYYLKIRKNFNDKKNKKINIKIIAEFLFLREQCFNGVYRENRKGEFNVPYGWTNKRRINYEKRIKEYNDFFNKTNIIFENMDVFKLLKKYNNPNETFIYCDPPYLNEKENENKYNKESFSKEDQIKLIEHILNYNGFLYSNHYLTLIKNIFDTHNIAYEKIARKNIMSASNETRKNDIFEILSYK